MKTSLRMVVAVLVVLNAVSGLAADRYVAQNGQTPASPYTDWTGAASNIQDAVDAAGINETVWIGSGRYTIPPNATNYNGLNVVFINKPLTLCSSNGVPADTIIDGGGTNRGIVWHYFANTSNQFVLDGITVSNCAATNYGGGLMLASWKQDVNSYTWTGVVRNCVIADNSATNGGGIAEHVGQYKQAASTLIISNSVIRNNRSNGGGGAGVYTYRLGSLRVENSIIASNLASKMAAGISCYDSTLTVENSIIHDNRVTGMGLPTSQTGGGGIRLDTCVASLRNTLMYRNYSENEGGAIRIQNAGANLTLESCTIAGNLGTNHGAVSVPTAGSMNVRVRNSIIRANYIDLHLGSYTDVTLVSFTNCSVAYNVAGSGNISNPPPAFVNAAGGDFRLKSYSTGVDAGITQTWMSAATDLAGQPRVSDNNLVDMGAYETSYEPHTGYYAAQNGQTPVSPYTNWMTAASNIQDAVNVYDINYPSTVWVGVGRYFAPAVPPQYYGPSVVVLDKALTLRSSNGVPANTIIDGGGATRGIAVSNVNAVAPCAFIIDGFTIANGYATNYGAGILASCQYGPITVQVQNCTIEGNMVSANPGGPSGGGGIGANNTAMNLTVSNCTIRGNVATNSDPLNALTGLGGGGVFVNGRNLISDCVIASNVWGTAIANGNNGGGGLYLAAGTTHTLRNTLLFENSGYGNGGGIYMFVGSGAAPTLTTLNLINCTLAANRIGYGVYLRRTNCTMNVMNTILYSNAFYNVAASVTEGTTFTNLFIYNSCIVPTNGITGGLHQSNTTNDPRFVNYAANDFRLLPNSPCINRGTNQSWMIGALDLGGKPRLSPLPDGPVDMGAYEFPIEHGSVFYVR